MIIVSSCNLHNDCDTLIIDNSKQEVKHTFSHDVKTPIKTEYIAKLKFNDTIILNGEKTPALDTVLIGNPMDYYGEPKIKLSYNRYKATDVYIEYKYCFY